MAPKKRKATDKAAPDGKKTKRRHTPIDSNTSDWSDDDNVPLSILRAATLRKHVEKFSIKRCFRQFCKDDKVFETVQKNVEEASRLAAEASIYIRHIHHVDFAAGQFPTAIMDVHLFHNQLCQHVRPNTILKYDISTTAYGQLRAANGLRNYELKQNIVNHVIAQYKTALVNNLEQHTYGRINKFLKHYQTNALGLDDSTPEQKRLLATARYETLKHVSGSAEADETKKDAALWAALRQHGYDGTSTLRSFRSNYWRFWRLMWNMQRYNQQHEIKNFTLFPIFKQKRHHICYDSKGLQQLLQESGLLTGNYDDVKAELPAKWAQYFQISRKYLEGHQPTHTGVATGHRFDFSISTNGVAVSLHMKRPKQVTQLTPAAKRHKDIVDEEKYLQRLRHKRARNGYTREIGIDPGRRLMLGGTIIDHGQYFDNIKDLKYSSASFRYDTGEMSRKRQYNKYVGQVEKPYNSAITELKLSPMNADATAYTTFRLLHFEHRQRFLEQRKVARLKLKKYIRVEQGMHKMAKELVRGHEGSTLIFIGSTYVAPNSPIKGYVRTPLPKLCRILKQYADVVEVDEFRTTVLCSRCWRPNRPSKSPHRFYYCRHCRITFNRDVNAGINIHRRGLDKINGTVCHANFQRRTNLNY